MAYCIPPKFADKFIEALKDGSIDPAALVDKSSVERRKLFASILGEENALEVNALFESKLLLKDVKRGLVTWAKQVGGITEPTRKDLLAKISRMPNELLNPVDESKFLADLAATKLGVTVTADEAKQIFELSKAVEDAKALGTDTIEKQRAYGEAHLQFSEYLDSLRPPPTPWQRVLSGAAALGRGAAIATGDLSAAATMFARVSSPEWWEATFKMLKWASDPKKFRELMTEIRGDADYDLMRSVVDFSELRPSTITKMEESAPPAFIEGFNEYLKQKAGGYIPNIAAGSNRAFVGHGNYTRYRAMKGYLAAGRLAGEDVSIGSKWLSDMGDVVNTTTARGRWGITPGGALEKIGFKPEGLLKQSLPAVSAILWTPRKQAALIRLFNPWYYVSPNISPMARKAQLRQLLGSMAVLGTTVSLYKMAGYDVETNPIATNFMRVGSGNAQFDFTQGATAYLRFYARFLTGYSESASGRITELGKGYKPETRLTLPMEMLRSRLMPWAGAVASALHGKDPAGRPYGVTQAMSDMLVPMTMGQLIELAVEEPDNIGAILLSPLTVFGVGMQVQSFNTPKSRWDALGAPQGTNQSENPVQRALDRVGIELNMPERMIRGVKLDDVMYDEYVQRAGKAVQQELASVLHTTNITRLPIGRQEDLIRSHVENAREHARGIMIGRHPELLREAKRAKDARRQTGSAAAQARRAQ